jgi:hypothetical protein
MDKELAFKWAEALDSGNHLQGRRQLEQINESDITRRCCLGVAIREFCDLSKVDVFYFPTGTYFDGNRAHLSEELQEQLGIANHAGLIESLRDRKDVSVSLAELNDSGFSFPQIADIIRYFYEDL